MKAMAAMAAMTGAQQPLPAASAALHSVVAAQANAMPGGGYSVADPPVYIDAYHDPIKGADTRGILEFDLSLIGGASTLTYIQFRARTSTSSQSSGAYTLLNLYAYAGNGTAEAADAIETALLIATTGTYDTSGNGISTFNFNVNTIKSLLGNVPYLGLLALPSSDFTSGKILLTASPPPNFAPELDVVYVPEPSGACAAAAVVVAEALLKRRPRSGVGKLP